MQTTKYKLSKSEERQLREKLQKTLITLVSITVGLFLLIFFFSPKLGVFFGFFSKHRNDVDSATVIKPSPPIFSNVPAAAKEESITLNGYAQPGLTVVLYVNGPETDKTTAGADGLFTFNNIKLISGSNTISAKVYDQSAMGSDSSNTFTVVVDKDKPKITVDSPKKAETVKNLDQRIVVTGKINEKSSIKINDKFAILRPDLTFEFLLGAKEGDMEIKVEATDEAGNVETEKFSIKYVKGS
jgi:hypothetical protein